MNKEFKPITPDGRTGFDEFGQLMTWTVPDTEGRKIGHIIRDVRAMTCYICGRGWGNTSEELANQVFQDDRTMHQTCLDGHNAINSHDKIVDVLIKAGFLFSLEEVPPRYPYSTPWQRVMVRLNDSKRTDSGYRIVLGRRKRVWEIRCHDVGDLSDKFEDVTDTKGYSVTSKEDPEFGSYYYVHAYTTDQMVDYLKRFHAAIPASISRS